MKKLMMIGGAVVAILSIEAKASTVAYWPLTQANGVRTTSSTVFANEGDNSAMERAAKAREKAGFLRTLLAELE